MFSAGRAFEQVRNSIAYPHLNVKIVGTHAGITVGEDGATHQCNEDLALMRSIPGMVVINPSDATESRAAVEAALKYDGPVYLRFSRFATPDLTSEVEGFSYEIGKGVVLAEGADVTIVACGYMVHLAMEAKEMLAAEGISATVIDMHTVKPLDTELLLAAARATGAVVTAEEHSINGGLGEAVASALSETYPVPVLRVGVADTFGRSGKVPPLLEMYGLTSQKIYEKAKAAIALKK
jgi:transketolase